MKRPFIVFALASIGFASDAVFETANLMNGRAWATWSEVAKFTYVRGVYDCASLNTIAATPSSQIFNAIVMNGGSFGEMTKGIDGFYRDSLNSRIPIMHAMSWVKMKYDGATPKALEEEAARLRAIFNKGTP